MKKFFVILLTLALAFSILGCEKGEESSSAISVSVSKTSAQEAVETTLPDGVGYDKGYFDDQGDFWLTDGSGYYSKGKFHAVDEDGVEEGSTKEESTTASKKTGIYAGKYSGSNEDGSKAAMKLTFADGKYKAKIVFKGFSQKNVDGTYSISFKESKIEDIGQEVYRIIVKDENEKRISIFFSDSPSGMVAQILVGSSANCAVYR